MVVHASAGKIRRLLRRAEVNIATFLQGGLPRNRSRRGGQTQYHGSVITTSIAERRRPVVISMEAGSECNLKCVMCALTLKTSSTSHATIFVSEKLWQSLLGD
jgi:hypothetical protein